jgi:aspartate aminotransferase-like enzyme
VTGTFFLPGPTEVRPEILAEMTRPMAGHRSPVISDLLAEVDPRLRAVFGTTRPVYVVTSSGTALMEAAVRCGVRRKALCLVNGAFSERFEKIVERCGREAELYTVPWGEAHDPAEVERRLRAGGIDAVTVVQSETSTGVLNPIAQIAQAVANAEVATGEEIVLLVDGVSSVGGIEVAPEAWGVDFLLTGSQKALALPPGLAFGTASERLLRRAETIPGRGMYLDLVEIDRYWKEPQTPATPAISLLYAMAAQLRCIEEEGIAARAARHWTMARHCWAWADEVGARYGVQVIAPAEQRSPTVSTLTVPAGTTGPAFAAKIAEHGFQVATGYGKLRESTIRIGHMGDHSLEALDALLGTIGEVLAG